jgi:hypothetical protein
MYVPTTKLKKLLKGRAKPMPKERDELLRQCLQHGLIKAKEATATRTRDDVSESRKARFSTSETCRKMCFTSLMAGIADKARAESCIMGCVEKLSVIMHQRSMLVWLHLDRLIREGRRLPNLKDPNAVFFRRCFTAGLEGASTHDDEIERTMRLYPDAFPHLKLPEMAGNAVTHAAKLYRTNCVNHFCLFKSMMRRIRRYATARLFSFVIEDEDDEEDEDVAKTQDKPSTHKVEVAVWNAVLGGLKPEEADLVREIRSMLGLSDGKKLSEEWLKANIDLSVLFVRQLCQFFDRRKAEVAEARSRGMKVKRGSGRGMRWVPLHAPNAHHVKIDATNICQMFKCESVAEHEELAVDAARGIFKKNLQKAFGASTAECFSGTFDTDGVSVSVHFKKPLAADLLAEKIAKRDAANERNAAKERGEVPVAKDPAPRARKQPVQAPKEQVRVDVGRVRLVSVQIVRDGKHSKYMKLTAGQYYTASGCRRAAKIRQVRRKKMGLDDFDRSLSRFSTRGADPSQIAGYAQAFAQGCDRQWEYALSKRTRNAKLRCRGGKARVLDQFWSRVKNASSKDATLVWGSAKVNPDGTGNLAVPTCGVFAHAQHRFRHVEPTDETGTSKTCDLCHGGVHPTRVYSTGARIVCVRPKKTLGAIRCGMVQGTNTKRLIRRVMVKGKRATLVAPCKVDVKMKWIPLKCHGGCTKKEKDDERREIEKRLGQRVYVRTVRGLRSCPGCQKLRDRDNIACDNIGTIFCCCAECKKPPERLQRAFYTKKQKANATAS